MNGLACFVLTGCFLATGASLHAQGYNVLRRSFEISTEREWKEWIFAEDAVEVLPDGLVRPAFFRKNINAVLDARSFTHQVPSVFYDEFAELSSKSPGQLGAYYVHVSGGVKDAGSTLRDGLSVMDGDIHTCWQPDPNDLLKHWWIELDLGRLVSATRIVLRFVEEGEGDPFLRFNVHVSRGDLPYQGAGRMAWRQVYRSEAPNYHQRVFDIQLDPERPKDMEGEGAVLQYVRVAVMDTRGERAEVVSKEGYERLPQDSRGPLVYHRKTPFWKEQEQEVSREGYERLPFEERGGIVYYRRELPRLAEVEVWTLGDNISLGMQKRGGSVQSSRNAQDIGDEEVDGAYTTYRKLASTGASAFVTNPVVAGRWSTSLVVFGPLPVLFLQFSCPCRRR